MSGGAQILTPGHQGDALQMVVQRGAEMIAGGHVAAAQHHVPETFRFGRDFAPIAGIGIGLPKGDRAGPDDRLGTVEPQREGIAAGSAFGRKIRMEIAACAGIKRGPIWTTWASMRGTGRGGDVLAAAEAGIEDAQGFQSGQGGAVFVEMIGLAAHRLLPVEAEPGEVLGDAGLEFGAAAGAVDILDAQEKAARILPCRAITQESGVDVAEMEMTCRTGRESRNYPGAGRKDHAGQE